MEVELSSDVIWCLRALSQEAHSQRELYPTFVIVADELVLDFDEAYSMYKQTIQIEPADLERLHAHIESKSGVSEFWTDEALDQSAFWNEIRQQARRALKARNLTASAPHPSPATYVSVSGGKSWTSGRHFETASEGTLLSVFKRFLNRSR